MDPVLVGALMLAGGMVLLLGGGKSLVDGAVAVATRLGMPPLLVGLTIVAWGTSAPELAFNTLSAVKGQGELAFGNVAGANICNLGLITGVCALMRPLPVQDSIIKRELPIMAALLGLMLLAGVFAAPTGEAGYSRVDGATLLAVFAMYSVWTIHAALRERRRHRKLEAQAAESEKPAAGRPLWVAIVLLAVGGVLLSVGGWLASEGAVAIAQGLGVPKGIIGLTVVAVGTTLPELAASGIAVRKGQVDLAIGNVVGSCMFNAGAIMGLASLIASPRIELPGAPHGGWSLQGGLPLAVMVGLGVAMIPICKTGRGTISRLEGVLLLAVYVGFLVSQVLLLGGGGQGVTP